ncbi:MAG: Rab family GTPase [Promethearchaeota archaeon]
MSKKFIFKIVTLGNGGVGKTCCIRRYADNLFEENYLPTIGVDLTTKEVTLEEWGFIKLILVDSGGQEYLGSLRPSFYHGTHGALIIFDLTNRKSFGDVEGWKKEIMDVVKQKIPMCLVGNKRDLVKKRVISSNEGQQKAQELEMPFYESSAKTGKNIEEMYHNLAKRILESRPILKE